MSETDMFLRGMEYGKADAIHGLTRCLAPAFPAACGKRRQESVEHRIDFRDAEHPRREFLLPRVAPAASGREPYVLEASRGRRSGDAGRMGVAAGIYRGRNPVAGTRSGQDGGLSGARLSGRNPGDHAAHGTGFSNNNDGGPNRQGVMDVLRQHLPPCREDSLLGDSAGGRRRGTGPCNPAIVCEIPRAGPPPRPGVAGRSPPRAGPDRPHPASTRTHPGAARRGWDPFLHRGRPGGLQSETTGRYSIGRQDTDEIGSGGNRAAARRHTARCGDLARRLPG